MNFRDTNEKNKTRAISLARLISVAALSIRENHWRLRAVKTDPDRDNSPVRLPISARNSRGESERESRTITLARSLTLRRFIIPRCRCCCHCHAVTLFLPIIHVNAFQRIRPVGRPANRAVNAFPAQILFPGETLAER